MLPLTAEDFDNARARIRPAVHCTPLLSSRLLGAAIGAEVHLKCEHLQKTGSFKARGALNKVLQLDPEARRRGVVTVSAGNHAQALAWAARTAGAACTVVMPENASPVKARASAEYGAEVILHGSVQQVFAKAHELERERGLTFIHPFDDPQIIAGAGSVGLEILEQRTAVTVVVVPVGGGGQIAGVAGAIRSRRSDVRIVGVEPEGAAVMSRSLAAGRAVHMPDIDTLADGLAPPMAGELNYEYVRQCVDAVVTVTDEQIVHAMGALLAWPKQLTEPSGAAATAALLEGKIPLEPSDCVVAVLSGGNVAVTELARFAPGWTGFGPPS